MSTYMNTYMKKIISVVVAVAVIATALVGCGEATTTTETSIRTYTTEGKETKLVGDSNLTGELTIATTNIISDVLEDPETGDILAQTERIFHELYPKVKINITRCDYNASSYSDYITKLSTEMMSGKGPDILFFNSSLSSNTSMNLDIYKMTQSGAIFDLYDYLENDKYINIKDFNSKVIYGSQINGGQYVIPVSYNYPAIFTSKTNADKYGLDVSKCTNLDGCITHLGDMLEKSRLDNKEQSAFRLASNMIVFSGLDLIDYNSKTVNLNTPEVKKIFEMQKKYFSQYASTNYATYVGVGEESMRIVQGIDVIAEQSMPYVEGLTNMEKIQDFDSPVMFPWRDVDGKIPGTIEEAVVVTNNCKDKELAYKFIKVLISEQPALNDMHMISRGIPIANSALLSKAVRVTNKSIVTAPDRLNDPLTEDRQKRVEEQIKVLDDIGWVIPLDNTYSIIYNEMLPYLKDEKSYEECIQSAQSKLEIYISE